MKIFGRIAVGLAETTDLDQVEHHPADVVGAADTPLLEDDGCHHPERHDGQIARAAKEFGPTDVAIGASIILIRIATAEPILGERDRVAYEFVCLVSEVGWFAAQFKNPRVHGHPP